MGSLHHPGDVLPAAPARLRPTLPCTCGGSRACPRVMSPFYGVSGERQLKLQRFTPVCKRFIYFDTCGLVSIVYHNTGEGTDKSAKVRLPRAMRGWQVARHSRAAHGEGAAGRGRGGRQLLARDGEQGAGAGQGQGAAWAVMAMLRRPREWHLIATPSSEPERKTRAGDSDVILREWRWLLFSSRSF